MTQPSVIHHLTGRDLGSMEGYLDYSSKGKRIRVDGCLKARKLGAMEALENR